MVDGVSPVFRTMGASATSFANKTAMAMNRSSDRIRNVIDTAKGFVLGNIINRGIQSVTSSVQNLTNEWIQFDAAAFGAAAKFQDGIVTFNQALEHTKRVSMEVGAQTKFTASEVAQAMDVMAMSGFTLEQSSTASMMAISRFATVAGTDIPTASTLLTGALASWKKDFSDIVDVSDMMVQTFTNSKMTLEDLGEAVKKSGSDWINASQDITTYLASVRALADINIVAEEAGTRMRSIIQRFYTEKSVEALASKGIAASVDGQFRPFFDILSDIRKITDDMESFDEGFFLKQGVVNTRDLTAFQRLLELSGGTLQDYAADASNWSEATERQFMMMSGSIQNRLAILWSAITSKFFGGAETARSPLAGVITDLIESVDAFDMTKINEWIRLNLPRVIDETKRSLVEMAPHLQTAGRLLLDIGTTVVKYLPEIVLLAQAFVAVKIAVFAADTAMGIWNISQAIGLVSLGKYLMVLPSMVVEYGFLATAQMVAADAQWMLNAALLANPIGLVIVAIVALIAVIVLVTYKWDEWGEGITSFNRKWGLLLHAMAPGLQLIANLVISLNNNWELVKSSFTDGGMLEGIKTIGKLLWNQILEPLYGLQDLFLSLGQPKWLNEFNTGFLDKLKFDVSPTVDSGFRMWQPRYTGGVNGAPRRLFSPATSGDYLNVGEDFSVDSSIVPNLPQIEALKQSFGGHINITGPEGFGVDADFSDGVTTSGIGLGAN